jgi:hypothetical protein
MYLRNPCFVSILNAHIKPKPPLTKQNVMEKPMKGWDLSSIELNGKFYDIL